MKEQLKKEELAIKLMEMDPSTMTEQQRKLYDKKIRQLLEE